MADRKAAQRAGLSDEIIYLYDAFTHGTMPRRTFLRKLAQLAGTPLAAAAMLPLLEGRASAQMTAPNDERLVSRMTSFEGASGPVSAYVTHPLRTAKRPAVVVIHQNKGLTHHIEDVARRLALEGFLAVAPDALSPLGGRPVPEDKTQGRDMLRKLDRETTIGDFLAAVAYAEEHDVSNGRVGAVGFCWGGSMVGELAARSERLDAGVIYYGAPVDSDKVARIRAPLQHHYAGLDERIGAMLPAYREALRKAGKTAEFYMYDGVHHAFNDDTAPARYDGPAAVAAWARTLAFFQKHLTI